MIYIYSFSVFVLDIAFVHLVSKEEESKLFLKIGHRRNYGKNVNVVLYQIPGNVSDEEQNSLLYLKVRVKLCLIIVPTISFTARYTLPLTINSLRGYHEEPAQHLRLIT